MGEILSLLQDFDVAKFLPPPETIVTKLELLMRVAVMVGPLVILGLGLWFYLAPPKEANHRVGFRTYWGMGSVEAWQYTQRLAGVLYSLLGTVMTVVLSLVCNGFRGMNPMKMANITIVCVVVEFVLIIGAWTYIQIAVYRHYDKDGNPKPQKRKK